MEKYDELSKLIKKWFNAVLDTPIISIEDLSDGQIFLEVLKEFKDFDISNNKSENYEVIELILDEFYKMKTNNIVYYENLATNKYINYDEILRLFVLIIGMYQKNGKSPTTLNQTDYQRLLILIKPIDLHVREKALLNLDCVDEAINKANEKDLDDYSSVMYSSNSYRTEPSLVINDDRNSSKILTREDDNDCSFNVPSCTSETTNLMLGLTKKRTNGDTSFNDDSTDSRRSRRSRGLLTHRKHINQSINYSHKNYLSSPKLSENKKQDAKKIKNMENEINYLKEEIRHNDKNSNKLNSDLLKAQEEITKMVLMNRKVTDNFEEMNEAINKLTGEKCTKEMELQKLYKQVNQMKTEKNDYSMEVVQINEINKELRMEIQRKEDELKSRTTECNNAKMAEVECMNDNQNLQNENQKLKRKLEDCNEELRILRMEPRVLIREQCLESPVPHNEGESMDAVTEIMFGEKQIELTKQIEEHRNEINELLAAIEIKDRDCDVLKNKLQILENKYRETVNENHEYSLKLDKAYNETAPRYQTIHSMDLESVVTMLTNMFDGTEFAANEKRAVLSQVMKIDENDDNRSHHRCQTTLTSLEQSLTRMQERFEEKCRENEKLNNDLEEISSELADTNDNNMELTKLYQIKLSKYEEDIFKVKRLLMTEKDEFEEKYGDLKRNLKLNEIKLKKSHDEYNVVRQKYDQSLESLKVLSANCHAYEEYLKNDKVYRNTGSQTDWMNYCSNIGTNVMSPRTPVTIKRSTIPTLNNYNYNTTNDRRDASLAYERDPSSVYRMHSRFDSPISNLQTSSWSSNVLIDKSSHMPPVKPEWVEAGRRSMRQAMKTNSPAVKPERIEQMWYRNSRQPEHLKSSYPVETQNIDPGYIASLALNANHLPLHDRVASARSNTANDGRHPRADMRTEYTENAMTDQLLKNSGLIRKKGVLSARSTNDTNRTPRADNRDETFRNPGIPRLNLESRRATHRDRCDDRDDRENAVPESNFEDDRQSLSSGSMSFSILNSPRVKQRGMPVPRNARRK